jgi:hypothetical protein
VNQADGVLLAQSPTGIDHFLTTPLHLRVLTLHRGKIQLRARLPRRHRRRCSAAKADQHRRAAEHDQLGVLDKGQRMHMFAADIADATGDHHRLVIASHQR